MTNLPRILCIAASLPLMAAHPDYFPLHVGNQWVYRQVGRAAGGDPVVVDIPRAETVNGQTYYVVRGLDPNAVYLRMAEDGTLYAYDPETRQEGVWAVFGASEGDSYRTVVNECSSTGVVRSRAGKVTVPAGEFTNALVVHYPAANCADAGLVADAFIPYVGLVERESLTIAGPRYLRLIYARIGGVTVLSEPEVTFSLTLDRRQYGGEPGVPMMTARLTLRSTQPEPVELTFPSGQRFDLAIKDEAGNVYYRWSADKSFIAVLGVERFGPGERNWVVDVPLAAGGERLPPGKYVAEAILTTLGPPAFTASVGFEVLPPR